jgi:hypothetical protein
VEEGPEPHEWLEKSAEHHLHEHEHGGHDDASAKRATTLSATTAAVLAVCAAIASLFSGHAANEAILQNTQAADHWAYYQSTSTKGHLHQVGADIVRALSPKGSESGTSAVLQQFDEQVKKYEDKKKELEEQAKEADAHTKHEFGKHFHYSLGVAAFQVGIVLASISIMIRYRALWVGSLVAGAIGMLFVLVGLLGMMH